MGEPLSVPPGFDELPVEEQIDYVQSLWRRIAKRSAEVPSPAWHIDVLERRRDALDADGERGRPWEDVRRDLQARLRAVREK